ncbi:extracellular solute-binding protein [Alicyclobacillus fodiniaquatilis]|uniref:Extracellular solute-binding protein n=1 Tax=Alicyclobacillus fodiniaquatilis TaxID=1661150 RepID=A0ABW4JKG5_9BACL
MRSTKLKKSLMRRAGVGVMAVASLSIVAGCGNSGGSTSESSGSLKTLTKNNITLSMWVFDSPAEVKSATAVANAFHKLHPNITIKVQGSAKSQDTSAVTTAAAGGQLPDILMTTDTMVRTEASNNVLVNLSPYMKAYGYKESDFNKLMQVGQYNNDQYMIPREADQIMVAYNPDLFKKFGVPIPKEGWTYTQYLADSKKLQQKVGNTQYYATGNGYGLTAYPLYEAYVASFGGKFSNAAGTKAYFDSPGTIKGFTELYDYDKEYSSIFDNLPSDPFVNGHAAMEVITRPTELSWTNSAQNAWSAIKFKVNFVNFPLIGSNPKIGGGSAGYAVTADSKYPKEAAAFMMYFLSKSGEQTYSKIAGAIPMRNDLKNDASWRDIPNVGYKLNNDAFVDYGQDVVTPPPIPIAAAGPISTDVTNALQAIQLGKETPKKALTDLNAQVNKVLASGQE